MRWVDMFIPQDPAYMLTHCEKMKELENQRLAILCEAKKNAGLHIVSKHNALCDIVNKQKKQIDDLEHRFNELQRRMDPLANASVNRVTM